MATIGAFPVFSALPGAMAGMRRALASAERRNRIRAGDWLTLVGAILAMSTALCSNSSETGLSRNALCVRASLNRRAREAASSGFWTGAETVMESPLRSADYAALFKWGG